MREEENRCHAKYSAAGGPMYIYCQNLIQNINEPSNNCELVATH